MAEIKDDSALAPKLSGLRCDSARKGWVNTCVINTCAVTATAEAKSRKLIRRFIRENPGSRLIVTGCLAQAKPDEVRKLLRPDDRVVGNKDKGGIAEMIGMIKHTPVSPLIRGDNEKERTRAFVKIQDGCNNFCSYCIVPFLRSEMWSKPPNTVDKEIRELVDKGYKEVVLTGINLGKYGNHSSVMSFPRKRESITGLDSCLRRNDDSKFTLVGLLRLLVKIDGLKRLRLSSIELEDVSDELIDLMAENPVICPHLHITLQSGSDRILKLMKRHYSSGDFIKRVNLLKRRIENPAITTDIIVGFPGETEDDFQQTLAVCKEVGFSKIHIFPFSPRQGTVAFVMTDKVKPDIIKKRFNLINNLARELALRYKQIFLNKNVKVLVEESAEGFTDRYIKIRIKPNGNVKPNQIVRVKITGIKPDYVTGIAVKIKKLFLSLDGRG
jgi:threonylcarbamoyladenosine tRNA methylthiotransferase MtaB